MELVVGGRAQGKLIYIKEIYNISDNDIANGKLEKKAVINNLQDIIYDLIKSEQDPSGIILDFANSNDCIFICDEVGSGIVPLQKIDRRYREEVGRICCELAKKSIKVHRVFAGIGTLIKG